MMKEVVEDAVVVLEVEVEVVTEATIEDKKRVNMRSTITQTAEVEAEEEEDQVSLMFNVIIGNSLVIMQQNIIIMRRKVCEPFSRAPHCRWAMGCGRRTRRSLPSVHLFNAG
jgi:precorrin-3B methylase